MASLSSNETTAKDHRRQGCGSSFVEDDLIKTGKLAIERQCLQEEASCEPPT